MKIFYGILSYKIKNVKVIIPETVFCVFFGFRFALFIYLFIYMDTNNLGLKVPVPY